MVDVLVQVFDRGEVKRIVVPVEEECFAPEQICWKTVACIKAAVVLELPFTMLLGYQIKYGMRPADIDRLREMYGGQDGGEGGAHCAPLQETGKESPAEGGRPGPPPGKIDIPAGEIRRFR